MKYPDKKIACPFFAIRAIPFYALLKVEANMLFLTTATFGWAGNRETATAGTEGAARNSTCKIGGRFWRPGRFWSLGLH